MTEIISVDKLNFKYQEDQNDILKDVTFHVKQGEWLSIVGHNGSGKSTVVRLI
ncbi:ATP-binding cassette domain-containing protein, partial [Streptococcus sobrinus]